MTKEDALRILELYKDLELLNGTFPKEHPERILYNEKIKTIIMALRILRSKNWDLYDEVNNIRDIEAKIN